MRRNAGHYKVDRTGDLTARQREVLGLVARGLTNAQIADELGLTLDGAKWHIREILNRLGAESREEAAALWASREGRAAKLTRTLGRVVALGLAGKVVAAAAIGGIVVAGGAFLWTISGGGNAGEVDDPQPESAGAAVTPTPVAAVVAVQGPACLPADLISGTVERVEQGIVILDQHITKPRNCALNERLAVFVVGPDADFAAPRIASAMFDLTAPVGTDRVDVHVEWWNWCDPVPVDAGAPRTVDEARTFQPPLWIEMGVSGSGSQGNYPACREAGTPTRVSVTATVSPDPPLPRAVIAPPPRVAVPDEALAFAQWLATVVTARDVDVLRSLAMPFILTCSGPVSLDPGSRNPLCKDPVAGMTMFAYVMDQSGQLDSESLFASSITRVMAPSDPSWLAAGCTAGPLCERFVVVFDAIAGTGPGSYQAFVFDAVDGNVRLRGLYPGGGDRDSLLLGRVVTTPWGPIAFSRLGP